VSCGLCFGSIVDEHDDAHAGRRTSIAKKQTRTNQRKKLSMGKTSLTMRLQGCRRGRQQERNETRSVLGRRPT